jgi:hypothetical protein
MSNTTDIINADELASILESRTSSANLVIEAKYLIEAINDWPTSVTKPEEFLFILNQEIGKPLTKENIERYVRSLDAGKSAWKMESFASVLAMFDNRAAETLNEIIASISNQFKVGNAE